MQFIKKKVEGASPAIGEIKGWLEMGRQSVGEAKKQVKGVNLTNGTKPRETKLIALRLDPEI